MKALFVSLFCSLVLPFNSVDNFSIEKNQLIWQQIYYTELTKDQLIWEIKSSGNFKNFSSHEGNLTAEISLLPLDVYGYRKTTVKAIPNFALYNHINAHITIEFKNDRYRVTIRSIQLSQKNEATLIIDLESIAFRAQKAEFNEAFINRRSEIISYTFQQITNFNETKEDNDW